MAKHQQQQLPLPKSTSQRCSEWVFRDVPSDIIIEVDGGTFSLHKFPLVSRSGRMRKLIAEHRESDVSRIELLSLPGGAESFELAAQFCYGINFEITAANVAHLCCVSDYLEMTEEYSKNNLGSRAEEYLESVVCKNLEMCVEVLQQCENLLPLADELNIVTRCIDGIASKACVEQIASSFSRLEYSSSGRLHMTKQTKCEGDWWIEDLSVLRVDLYQRVITAIKCRGVRPESASGQERLVVETIISLLPVEKFAVPITFLFGMLRSAVMLDCSVACRLDLERRIGCQILVNFSQLDDSDEDMDDESVFESDSQSSPSQTALFKVSKLVDNYLAEIAPDANLKLNMFIAVAETLPAHARTIHDGLYRAIDVYLKAHQGLSDPDKRKLCKLIDFQKLSQEAEDDPKPMHQSWRINSGARSAAMSPRDNYASLRRENRDLKLDLARMRMRLNDLEKDHVYMKRNLERSSSKKFMSSFSKKIVKLNIFARSSSRGVDLSSKHSLVSESKLTERT
ncbi:hypothetical protein DH2020_021919 [Rehmannia glutinosa]|uniref:BTB/POZ domain-containing protein n=1 Tax=Rehmannia glutinosa TaxID=99300 RepID=A0ABR0WGA6_REHGL